MVQAGSKLNTIHFDRKLMRPVLQIALIVALALVGYHIAPPDLASGAYVAKVNTLIDGKTLTLDFPFALAKQSVPRLPSVLP